jgi:hypothetical protein
MFSLCGAKTVAQVALAGRAAAIRHSETAVHVGRELQWLHRRDDRSAATSDDLVRRELMTFASL